mgnify:CR=1 FL=1
MRVNSFSVLLASVATTCDAYAFRICGAYCGPGWCNDEWLPEANCSGTAEPQENSCADACCKTHDYCCGHLTPSTGKRACNTNIVECLQACTSDSNCTDAIGIHVAPSVISTAMSVVEGWCCGEPCPTPADGAEINATMVEDAPAANLISNQSAA